MSDSMTSTIPAIPHDSVGRVARFGRSPPGARIATSCLLLWPAAAIFAVTGSVGSALAAAGGAWVFRHAWEGGARAAADRMRDHGFWALRSGHYGRAKRIYERLWAVRPSVRARFSVHELSADRLNYATSLVLVGQAARSAEVDVAEMDVAEMDVAEVVAVEEAPQERGVRRARARANQSKPAFLACMREFITE